MRVLPIIAIALWLGMVAAGFGWLAAYETRPGEAGAAPRRWPEASHLALDPQRWNLVMFLHPHCPCSPASLQELDQLRSGFTDNLHVQLVFSKPAGVPSGWEQTATWKHATALSHIDIVVDEGDKERRAFGALTSGEVLLYDPGGALRYRGGITAARGKVGPSVGSETVTSLLGGERPARSTGPVYGCPLTSH
jgi:hypothetical protein